MGCGISCMRSGPGHEKPAPGLAKPEEPTNDAGHLQNSLEAAAEQAAKEIQKVQDAANAMRGSDGFEEYFHSMFLKAQIPEIGVTPWDRFTGPGFEELLQTLDLVDAQYLIALSKAGGIVPRCQDIPEAAKITKEQIWRLKLWSHDYSLPVLVLSYPWLDKEHPDRLGTQLRSFAPILEFAVATAQRDSSHATVGVMWDYTCLPQKPFSSETEKQRFKYGLGNINKWYAHPFLIVLMVTTPLPTDATYTVLRSYEERGWCFFEKAISSLVKDRHVLWDITNFRAPGVMPDKFRGLCDRMAVGRKPPLSPPRFEELMRNGIKTGNLAFTAAADLEFVIKQYADGFVAAFELMKEIRKSRPLFLVNLHWDDTIEEQLVNALMHVKERCNFPEGALTIDLSGNNFSSEARSRISSLNDDTHLDIVCEAASSEQPTWLYNTHFVAV